jgi:hypothetical protein
MKSTLTSGTVTGTSSVCSSALVRTGNVLDVPTELSLVLTPSSGLVLKGPVPVSPSAFPVALSIAPAKGNATTGQKAGCLSVVPALRLRIKEDSRA